MRAVLRNIALLLTVSACAFGIVEAVARHLASSLPQFDYRSVDAKGYGVFVPAPNQDLTVQYEDLDRTPFDEPPRLARYRIVTGPDGQRIPESAGTFPSTSRRIVVLGDSFSFGSHANYDQSLAGKLQNAFPSDAVLNFAVNGASSYELPGILRYFLTRTGIRPDVLVLGIYVDLHIGDLPRRLARERFGPYRAWNGFIVGPSRYTQLESSAAARALFWFQTAARANLATFNLLVPPAPFSEFALDIDVATAKEATLRYRPLLARTLAEIGAASGLGPDKIVVWLVPSNHEANNDAYPTRFDKSSTELHAASQAFWNSEAAELQKAGYGVVDARQAASRRVAERVRYPFAVDGHFNESGFELAANLIAPAIRTRCPEC